MKILYISTVFPRQNESDTIYTDLAEYLCQCGHDLTVVVGDGHNNLECTSWVDERNMKILRVKTGNLYNVGFIQKGISVLTIKWHMRSAIRKYLSKSEFDLILFEAPPLSMVSPVAYAMKLFNCPSYLMMKDIFPQNAIDLNIISRWSPLYLWFRLQEKKLYKTANWIGCMSDANIKYLIKHNAFLSLDKLELFLNVKKIHTSLKKENACLIRKKYKIPSDKVVAVFGGNMGKPQGLDFLMDIIANNKNRSDAFFLLVGRGSEYSYINNRIKKENIQNVMQLQNLPREEYEALVRECDIGLICLDRRFTIPNYPSRVLTYFEYSMPVLAALDPVTDFGEMLDISGGGYWVVSGDYSGFQEYLDKLVKNPELRKEMGIKGRRYMEENLTLEKDYITLMNHFKKIDS